jgi:2,4-dienoyl-CoA reductase-like NADH-dependent reductase (Old Yellow Enzyme family)
MSEASPAEVLGQSLELPCGEVLPNRLAKAAMTEGLADHRGRPGERLGRLYRAWSEGGAGLLITGNVQIDWQHLERPGNVVIDRPADDELRKSLQDWAEAARSTGNGLWMQISHAGRQTQSTINPRPKAPSAIPLALPGKLFGIPVPLTESEIEDLIERFAGAALIAAETGFTGAQIHAAHGYLISEFLSPLANQRDDRWGGSLENRARLLLEVVRRARQRLPSTFALAVKLNSADFQKGGFAPEESLQVASWLQEAGIDALEISGGSYESPKMMNMPGLDEPDAGNGHVAASTAAREAYFLQFAAEMRREVKIPLMVTGGFRSAAAMAQAIAEDGIGLIGLARPMCVDPAAPKKLLDGQPELERFEDRLRVGPGWFGPQSPFAMLKAINGFGVMSWYYQQLRRLGDGQPPDPKLRVFPSFVREQWTQRTQQKASQRELAHKAPTAETLVGTTQDAQAG